MKLLKTLGLTAALLAVFNLFPAFVSAQEVIDPELCRQNPNATLCEANRDPQDRNNNSLFGPSGVLTKAAQLLAVVVGVAAVIMIIIGGLQYVLASGDPSNIQNAKNTIFYAIVGLLVAALAQGIIAFVLKRI